MAARRSALIRAAVIGVGYLGRFHAQKYASLPNSQLIGIADPSAAARDALSAELKVAAHADYRELLGKVDAVSIVTPTPLHFEVAKAFLDSGAHVLVEKPMTVTTAEGEQLIDIAKRAKRILQVGHLERFNAAVLAVQPSLSVPRFVESARLAPFKHRGTDVDVVLDLMIHDLDVVLAFVNSPVKEIRAVGLPILSGKVDIANVRMEFISGCVANLTASRVSTERVRKLRFFQPGQYISIDYGRQDVIVFSVGGAGNPTAVPSVNPQISMGKPAVTAEEPLHAELKSFLDCVRQRSQPLVSLAEGRRALAVAFEIVAAIGQHNQRLQLERLGQP